MDTLSFFFTAVFTMVLVITTLYYSIQSKKQLEKRLEDTKTELAMATRPLLVARAVVHEGATTYEDISTPAPKGTKTSDERPPASHFSHFELFNAGNSPAIGLEISLINNEMKVLQSESLGFLRNNEPALTFVPTKLELNKSYFLVCEYDSIRSRVEKIWYQTWLPFTSAESSTRGSINIAVGELKFKEVSEAEHIAGLSSRG
jgi:hypothetical protein